VQSGGTLRRRRPVPALYGWQSYSGSILSRLSSTIYFQQMRRFLVNLLRVKESEYHIGIQIDRLTNSIINTISGDSFETEILAVTKEDLKGVTKKAGWKFDWKGEAKGNDRNVYKLTI
jgi:hypothetical protein